MKRLALLAVAAPLACALAQRPDPTVVAADTTRPTLAFTVTPRDASQGDRTRRVTVWRVITLATAAGRVAYYRVQVVGLADDRLVYVLTGDAPDVALATLRQVADDAARRMLARARVSCDTLRPRKPAETFEAACA